MAFLIGAGLAFFALPGILLLRSFVLAPYFIVQNNLGILESLRLASKRTAPYAWSLYSVFGTILLFSILGVFGLPGAISGAILSVLYSMALPLRFQEITNTKNHIS